MSTCKCPHCGGEINPASLLGLGKKKTMSDAALAARKSNSKNAGRPKDAYTMQEIKAEIKRLGFDISKRSATINGSAAYKVDGDNFNPAVLYTKSDLIEKLFL